ncbi:hypothetical protein OMP43_21695 [Sphingomonas sp. CBMAI 2297]|uniref:hypothetical protein n=1 Tax=Sphingomonas sp. CBMAI 2297 TaxID=2991720 RepID=UPI002455E680|nr:hypothetical protein [Sphingomonas sp. CBMAI 2297]MDH4746644.1 hypothetical protein [Sphingomonas sp. CBMAI 2297]
MANFGCEGSGIIALDFWLIVKRGEQRPGWPVGHRFTPAVRVKAGEPDLAKNERAVRVEMNVPTAIFETPALHALINIESPQQLVSIDVAAAAEAVKQATGMDVEIRVVEPEGKSE